MNSYLHVTFPIVPVGLGTAGKVLGIPIQARHERFYLVNNMRALLGGGGWSKPAEG